MNGAEMTLGVTAMAIALAAQFEDTEELQLFIMLLIQLGYAMEVIYLGRKRTESICKELCEEK